MSMMDIRRRMLLNLKIKDFIIFLNGILEGEVKDVSSESSKDSYLNIKGHQYYHEGDKRQYSVLKSDCSTTSEAIDYVKQIIGNTTGYTFSCMDGGNNWYVYALNTLTAGYKTESGYITIGSYDFTKYKTLRFTVTNYSSKGSVSFGDISKEIVNAGEYEIDIKVYEGEFDITFNSDSANGRVDGYSISNIYLKG